MKIVLFVVVSVALLCAVGVIAGKLIKRSRKAAGIYWPDDDDAPDDYLPGDGGLDELEAFERGRYGG